MFTKTYPTKKCMHSRVLYYLIVKSYTNIASHMFLVIISFLNWTQWIVRTKLNATKVERSWEQCTYRNNYIVRIIFLKYTTCQQIGKPRTILILKGISPSPTVGWIRQELNLLPSCWCQTLHLDFGFQHTILFPRTDGSSRSNKLW